MKEHHDSKHAGQAKLEQYAQPKQVNTALKEKLKQAQVDFSIGTLTSFQLQETEAFFNLCNFMIKIGNKYGSVDSRDILFGRKTISTEVSKKVVEIPKLLIRQQSGKNVAFTADIWSSKYNNDSFLEVHSIWSDGIKLKTCQVEMKYFNGKHTAQNIREYLVQVLSTIGRANEKIFITTDCGANMLKAVEEFESLKCACHRLSTAVENAWISSIKIDDNLKDLESSCNALQISLTHSTDIQSKLPHKVKPGCQTRA